MRTNRFAAMASPSVSFRISRSTEDLAGTLHLLSQRLVQLEQRLELLEGQRQAALEDDPDLVESLGNAERLLLDCRALLGGALDDQPGIAAGEATASAGFAGRPGGPDGRDGSGSGSDERRPVLRPGQDPIDSAAA
jgi:hypothetical protein